MQTQHFAKEIKDINLSYLLLAQNLVRHDRADALYRLGLSEEAADFIALLTTSQLMALADSAILLSRLRLDDSMILGLLAKHKARSQAGFETTRLHANILMAGNFEEAL